MEENLRGGAQRPDTDDGSGRQGHGKDPFRGSGRLCHQTVQKDSGKAMPLVRERDQKNELSGRNRVFLPVLPGIIGVGAYFLRRGLCINKSVLPLAQQYAYAHT